MRRHYDTEKEVIRYFSGLILAGIVLVFLHNDFVFTQNLIFPTGILLFNGLVYLYILKIEHDMKIKELNKKINDLEYSIYMNSKKDE